MDWLPGDGVCLWGGVSKGAMDCAADAVALVVQVEVIDTNPPKTGLVAVPVCADHGKHREWDRVEDAARWRELQVEWDEQVWLMERQPI